MKRKKVAEAVLLLLISAVLLFGIPNYVMERVIVDGPSMETTLQDGDNILVKRQTTAKNGDMVVALVDDSATVKTFYKENGHIRLQPENDYMDPIILPDVEIIGKVFGVFRFFN